ncbi:Pollen receptor-like kinase 6 [Glycine soja]|uniref:Pollen receptor-like kinase 6 n=1 Tax=Glycine soja TaxID=3848 RepID=A0A445KDA7_GLYSO|nr:Pollen receptor-like kinase 6 [Glycine soja]
MTSVKLISQLSSNRGTSHVVLDWPARLKIVRGIAQGMHYLYTVLSSSDLPHGNLKSNNAPEAAQQGQVSRSCDVYCLGVVIIAILTGRFPSQYLSNGKGGADVVQWVETAISEGRELEVLDPEIAGSRNWLGEMEQLLHIGAACTESNPQWRLDMAEAVRRIMEIKFEGGHESRSLANSHHGEQSQRRHGTNSFESWDDIEYGSS